MRNLVLLSVITSTIACQESGTSDTTNTEEVTQQRVELQPNTTRMTASFQQYVDRQVDDFAHTQNKLAELQPTGPECLFGGEIQGQIDMSQSVPAWHIELSDDQGLVVQELEPLITLTSISPEDRQIQVRMDNLQHQFDTSQDIAITLQFEFVDVEMDLSIDADQEMVTGEWVICPVDL